MSEFDNFNPKSWISDGLTRHIGGRATRDGVRKSAQLASKITLFLPAFAVACALTFVAPASATQMQSAFSRGGGIPLPALPVSVSPRSLATVGDRNPSMAFAISASRLLSDLASGQHGHFDKETLEFAAAAAKRQVVVNGESEATWVAAVAEHLGDLND
jgi:hypothetical protein